MGTRINQNGTGNQSYVDNSRRTRKTTISIGTTVVIVGVVAIAIFLFIQSGSFSIEGKWQNVGNSGFGQAQPGSIITFDGNNCNFYSPNDTYALHKSGDNYRLDVTSYLFGENLSFSVKVKDKNQIEISSNSTTVILKRVN